MLLKPSKIGSKDLPRPLVTASAPKDSHDSLWCITLVTPWSEEKLLLEIASGEQKSIFQCDGYAVYSNPVLDIGGLKTRLLDVDLHAPIITVNEHGISYETKNNSMLFASLWHQVIGDGDFKKYDWTVKVHPDAVFLPNRLRTVVASGFSSEGPLGNGVLINNCKLGLHSAVEVLSTRALQVYAAGHHRCRAPPQEDVYFQNCLDDLGVAVVDNSKVLADESCYRGDWHQSPEWYKCTDNHAAFHPFKSAEAYLLCLQAAERSEQALL